MEFMDDWLFATLVYCAIAFLTFLPVLRGALRKVRVNEEKMKKWADMIYCEDGPCDAVPDHAEKDSISGHRKHRPRSRGFSSSNEKLSDESRKLLREHFIRMYGTLLYWKNRAEWNRKFHYYVLCWTLPIAIVIPVMVTFIDFSFYPKVFLAAISLHSALLLGFHRALKVENNYKEFRQGKSEFCDLLRRMLDRPKSFGGESEEEWIANYFEETERIRKVMRSAEVDNFPGLDVSKGNNNQ